MINPAITGNYLGVVRTTLNQRVQYASFGVPYNTSMITVDKSIRRKGRRRDRISYGAYAVNDRAYTQDRIELRQYSISLGYHKLLEKKKHKHKFLSIGLQNGFASRIALLDNFSFDRQITQNGFDPTIDNGERFGRYCIKGANEGKTYGLEHKDDIEALNKINDFEWLREQFVASMKKKIT